MNNAVADCWHGWGAAGNDGPDVGVISAAKAATRMITGLGLVFAGFLSPLGAEQDWMESGVRRLQRPVPPEPTSPSKPEAD